MATISNGNNGTKKGKYKKFTLNLPRTAKLSNEAIFKSVTENLIKNQLPPRKRIKDGHFSNTGIITRTPNPIQGIIDYGMDQRAKKIRGLDEVAEALEPELKKRPSNGLRLDDMLPETKKSFLREAMKNLKKFKRR